MDILTTLIQKGASLKTLQEVSACLGGYAAPAPQQQQQGPQLAAAASPQSPAQPQSLAQSAAQPQQSQSLSQLDKLETAINRMSDLYEKSLAQMAAAQGLETMPQTAEDIAASAIAGLMQSEVVR